MNKEYSVTRSARARKTDILRKVWLSKSCTIAMEWSVYTFVELDHKQLVYKSNYIRTRQQTAEKQLWWHLSS